MSIAQSTPNTNFGTYIGTLLYFQDQTKIYHWLCTAQSKHKVLDQLYNDLNEFIDKFVETYSGLYEVLPEKVSRSNFFDTDIANVTRFLNSMRTYVFGMQKQDFIDGTDIENLVQEFESKLNNAMYLYRMD